MKKLAALVKRFWFVMIFGPVPFYWIHWQSFEDHIRWHATALQMLGLWLVYRGLMDTAKRFEVPTPWATAKAWFEGLLPSKDPEPVGRSISAATGSFRMGGGNATMTFQRATATDSQRIDELERLLKEHKADMERVHQANTQKFKQLDKQVGSLAGELGKEINEVKAKMHAQTAGGLGESFMGLAWVAFGTLLGGLTTEAARLLHWVWA